MTRRQAIEGAGYFTAPAVLVIGGSLATLALTGVRPGPYGGEAAQPGPRPTVTVTATAAEQTPAPSPSSSSTEVSRTVVAAQPAGRPAAAGGGGRTAATGQRGGGSRSSTAPQPAPSTSPSAPDARPATCSGGVLAVRLPLGVLPRCGITIGGSR